MSYHKKYLSVALLSAVLLPAMASAADAPATFTPEQEAKIGKIAADYLVAHPEVLLQASQKLQQIQAEQQASAATQAVLKNAAVLTQIKYPDLRPGQRQSHGDRILRLPVRLLQPSGAGDGAGD